MAFCTTCGADVTGKNFCVGCGKPVGAAPPAAPVTPQAPPQAYAPPAPPMQAAPMQGYPMQGPPAQMPPKKMSPWVWVAIGVVGFFLLIGAVISIGVGMFVHKVKANPALTMAKLLTAGNPDVEVVGSDSTGNRVTFRDKKTGETITMDFDDIKKGKIAFKGNKGEVATIQAQGSGDSGSVEIKGPDGSMKFGSGANAKVPDWIPAYPGVTPVGTFSMQGADGSSGSYQFTTKDPASAVLSHYENGLKSAGFKINASVTGNSGSSNGGLVSAEDEATKRNVVVTVGTDNGNTTVSVMFATKK